MSDSTWMDEYKKWKDLKPYQLKLLEEGAKSQSQAWLINSMWCEWIDIKKIKDTELPLIDTSVNKDPWIED